MTRDEVATAFGEVVRSRRDARGESQVALARRVGMDRSHLWEIETGKRCPGLDLVVKLCLAVGIEDVLAEIGALTL